VDGVRAILDALDWAKKSSAPSLSLYLDLGPTFFALGVITEVYGPPETFQLVEKISQHECTVKYLF
jgi:hypothetical protein